LAIAGLALWQAVLPNFFFDNSFSIAAAKNVAEGNGFTTYEAMPNDISVTKYIAINKWPPGYSWLMAVVMKVANSDAVSAMYVVNVIAIIFFIGGISLILKAIRFPQWAINFFLLFAGFFPYPFLEGWFSDLTAVSFFTMGIGLVMHAHTTGKNLVLYAALAGVLCGFCIFLKYLYLPVAILPLVVWAWYSLRTGKRKQFSAALGGAVIVSFLAIMLLLFQTSRSGQAVYLNSNGRGFFPEHVKEIGPLIPASLVDDHFLSVQVGALTGWGYNFIKLVLRIINYPLMALLLFWVYRWVRNKNNRKLYTLIVLIVSTTTSGMLLVMSLTQEAYRAEFTPFWTFVEELRYYGIMLLFIQQWVFWYFLVHKQEAMSWWRRVLQMMVVLMIFVNIAHGAYYLVKQGIIKKQIGINKPNEQVDLSALHIVEKLKKQYPTLMICSNNHELVNIASLSGVPVLQDFELLKKPLLTTKPVIFVAIIQDKFLNRFQFFMDQYKPVKVDHSYGFSFYLATIPVNEP